MASNETRRERERLVREGEIIAAAEKIFGEKGFDNASMDEIALEAEFTKRTLYLYFENKEELFFAAAKKGFKKLLEFLQKGNEDAKTGYEKLVNGSRMYYRFYKESPGTLRLIGELGQVKKKAQKGSQRLKDLMQANDELFKMTAEIMAEGKADGSISNDINEIKMTFSVIFMMTGFFNQLALTGATFTENFSLDPEDFSSYSMDLLFRSIKSK